MPLQLTERSTGLKSLSDKCLTTNDEHLNEYRLQERGDCCAVARTAARSDQAVLDFLTPPFAAKQKVERGNRYL